MKQRNTLACSIAALILLPGCQTAFAPESRAAADSAQTVAVVEAYFAGLNQNDISAVPFAPDAVLLNPMLPDPVVGADNIKQLINGAIGTLDAADVKRQVIDGNKACVLFDYIDQSGLTVNIVDCFVVEDGEIVDLQLYYDPRRFLEAAPAE